MENRTYEIRPNCGRVIIAGAKVIKVLLIIWAILPAAAVAIVIAGIDRDLIAVGILVGILLLTIGILLAVFLADLVKGYGQIVQNSALNATALAAICEQNHITIREANNPARSMPPAAPQNPAYLCPHCGSPVSPNSSFCGYCGQQITRS